MVIKRPVDKQEINNIKEVVAKVRDYLLDVYERRGYDDALTVANDYLKESNKSANKLEVIGLAPQIRGELSEVFLEICLREFCKTHKGTFYMKSLCIKRTDGKDGYTELDLTLFTKKRIFLFECKSYSGKKRLIEEGLMITNRFAPYNVFSQCRMHLDNFRRYLTMARLKKLEEGKPYSMAMFSFSNDETSDMREEEWRRKFPLLLPENIFQWLDNIDRDSKELWDVNKLFSIVKELKKTSDSNFKKHIALSKAKQDNKH